MPLLLFEEKTWPGQLVRRTGVVSSSVGVGDGGVVVIVGQTVHLVLAERGSPRGEGPEPRTPAGVLYSPVLTACLAPLQVPRRHSVQKSFHPRLVRRCPLAEMRVGNALWVVAGSNG